MIRKGINENTVRTNSPVRTLGTKEDWPPLE